MAAWTWLGRVVTRHVVSTEHTVVWRFGLVLAWLNYIVIAWARSLLQVLVKASYLAATSQSVGWCLILATLNRFAQHTRESVVVGSCCR